MPKFRYTTPAVESTNTARILSVTFDAESQRVTATVVFEDDSVEPVLERKRTLVSIDAPPPLMLTQLNGLVTRLYNYLVNQGVVPAGSEE